jgi:hypothetical protein
MFGGVLSLSDLSFPEVQENKTAIKRDEIAVRRKIRGLMEIKFG